METKLNNEIVKLKVIIHILNFWIFINCNIKEIIGEIKKVISKENEILPPIQPQPPLPPPLPILNGSSGPLPLTEFHSTLKRPIIRKKFQTNQEMKKYFSF